MLQFPPGSKVITSGPGRRDLNLTKDVIYQFDVEYTARYRKGTNKNNQTRCNVFVGDVLAAMRAPLPTQAQFDAGGAKGLWVGAADAYKWLTGTKGTGTWKASGADAGG